MEIKEVIKNIGFSNKEAAIYLALLELGTATVQQISQKIGFKRTSLYPILDSLVSNGYISFIEKKHGRLYFAEPPRKLLAELKTKEKLLKEILPELEAIYNFKKDKPKITFYEGYEAYRRIYDDTLNVPRGSEIYEFTSLYDIWRFVPKSYEKEYIKKRLDKKIRIKIIAIDSVEARQWVEKAPYQLREIVLIPRDNKKITAAIEIYGDKVGIISLKENFMGIIIESQQIAQMQKIAFELMWEQSKQIALAKYEFNTEKET